MTRARSQRWVLDTLVGVGGLGVLFPEAQGFFEELGYNHADAARVFGMAKSGAMFPKAWSQAAGELERKAQHSEARGLRLAARDLYARAAICYGRAQSSYYRDDERKRRFHDKMVQCYTRAMVLNPTPIERVEIPFEGKTLYGVLHLPAPAGKFPAVLLSPGMDGFKEDRHAIAQTYFRERGLACLVVDGPGQGETLLNGLKVNVTNYERAGSALLDYLQQRPEIDGERLCHFGMSMGSYWGARIAAHDKRLKACATMLGCYGSMEVIFNQAQPTFKANFMYMAGYTDEAAFDEEIARHMHLKEVAPKIACPFLMAHGEFDELTPLEDALATYALVKAPKEIWVYDWEFHPLGGVAAELIASAADWLVEMLKGNYLPTMDNRYFVGRDGKVHAGSAEPPWWNPYP